MPVKRPCTHGRCPKYAVDGSSKCEDHKKEHDRKSFDKIQRKHDFYNTKFWRNARAVHLRANPFCVECKAIYNLQVDHIEKFGTDWVKFADQNNWQTLCRKCHLKKTGRGE